MVVLRAAVLVLMLLVSACSAPQQRQLLDPTPVNSQHEPADHAPTQAAVTRHRRYLEGIEREIAIVRQGNDGLIKLDTGGEYLLRGLRSDTYRVQVVGGRHLLISAVGIHSQTVHATVFMMEDEQLVPIGWLNGDKDVRADGDRIIVERWTDAGRTTSVSYVFTHDSVTSRYEEVPGPLINYKVVGTVAVPLPDDPHAVAHVVQRLVFHGAEAPVGVYLQSRGESLFIRPPFSFDGTIGPDYRAEVIAQDLDGDGQTEYIISGAVGAYNYGWWVYRYDPTSRRFHFINDLVGFGKISLEVTPGGTYIHTRRRDVDRRSEVHQLIYVWRDGTFVQIEDGA